MAVVVAVVFFRARQPVAPAEPAPGPRPAPAPTAGGPPQPMNEGPGPAVAPDEPEAAALVAAPEPTPVQTLTKRLNTVVGLLTSTTDNATFARQARDLIDATYAPLYQQLGLSPDDANALGNLLVQRLAADRQGLADAASQGFNLTDNPVQVAQVVRARSAPVETQIATMLGDENYRQYVAFATPLRAVVGAALRQNTR